jgi:hypothetical protein
MCICELCGKEFSSCDKRPGRGRFCAEIPQIGNRLFTESLPKRYLTGTLGTELFRITTLC